MPAARPVAARRFLFLQGPNSPFFAEVAARLAAHGHAVRRINLCLGDRLFWRSPQGAPKAIDYAGRPADWGSFVGHILDAERITDLILMGEQRPAHRVAIAEARRRAIAVTVTDLGYFRPDWITLERDGHGGGSHFPHDPDTILRLAEGLPPADLTRRYRDSFARQAAWDMVYHLSSCHRAAYPHHDSHLLHHPLRVYAGIGQRLLRRGAARRHASTTLFELAGSPLWLFAMQIEADFSVRSYSPHGGLAAPLRQTVRSFGLRAPSDGHLLVKVHPLDPCITDWRREIAAMADEAGVSGRVHVLHDGPLDAMIDAVRGVITVNSTVGLQAIVQGRPVKALGQAVWDVPGLAHQGTLDGFWTRPERLDAPLRDAFLAALQAETQIRGTFFAPAGRRAAVAETVRRLHEDRVGVRSLPVRLPLAAE